MMNKREIRRKAKDGFRKAMSYMPMPVKRYLTVKKIEQLTRPLLSLADLRTCEQDPDRRSEIIQKHRQSHAGVAAALEQKIQAVFSDPKFTLDDAKTAAWRDGMEYAYYAYGFPPSEFVSFHLDERDLRTFVSDTERRCLKHAMNDFTQSVFADKGKVYQLFQKWYKRDAVVVETADDYQRFEKFAQKHPSFVVKVVNSSRGKGITLWKTTDDLKRDFDEIRSTGKVLLEELIDQHEALSKLNNSSINTVRVSAYLTRDGVVPGHGVVRTGRNGSFVDNLGAGGLEGILDVQKGVILSNGIDKYGHTYLTHPDSGVAFQGFTLPDWDDALTLIRDAAQLLPEVKYKSFDLSYSKKGWVIVEINPSGELGLQGCMETGMKEPLRKITGNMDLICKYTLR